MAGLVVPNVGELRLLQILLKESKTGTDTFILHLYNNDYTPATATTLGMFSEATFTNYTVKTLLRNTWNDAITVSNKAEASYGSAALSWTCGTTGNTIYGYYVTEPGATEYLLWAEKFSTQRILASGDILNLTPKFTLSSEN